MINAEYIGLTIEEAKEDDQDGGIDKQKDNEHPRVNAVGRVTTSQREVRDWEGCFSVPGMSGFVRRYGAIRATFSSMDGNKHSMILYGWPARVFQHETDHTEGRLFDDAQADRCSKKLVAK